MVLHGFELVQMGDIPPEEAKVLRHEQSDWSVVAQKAIFVDCRIRVQFTEQTHPDGWHRLHLVIWHWTLEVHGHTWKVFEHAQGIRDRWQNHGEFLDRVATYLSSGL